MKIKTSQHVTNIFTASWKRWNQSNWARPVCLEGRRFRIRHYISGCCFQIFIIIGAVAATVKQNRFIFLSIDHSKVLLKVIFSASKKFISMFYGVLNPNLTAIFYVIIFIIYLANPNIKRTTVNYGINKIIYGTHSGEFSLIYLAAFLCNF